jgi:hypothetical protein
MMRKPLRAARTAAPDVFRFGGWLPMREHHDDEAVDFVIVGTGAGGGTLACRRQMGASGGRSASA